MLKTIAEARDLPLVRQGGSTPNLDFQQERARPTETPSDQRPHPSESEVQRAESEQPNGQPSLKEKARRSRKDQQGRNYNCGCGKKYLSYPALYTHIRNKHFGKTPEGTRNTASNATKRGRPKRVPDSTMQESSEGTERNFETYVELSDLTILKHLDDNYEGEFELASEYEEVFDETLCKFYRQIITREAEQRPQINTPFGLVLAHYCIGISKLLNHTLCWNYIQFLKVVRLATQIVYKCFEDHAEDVLNNCFAGGNANLMQIRLSLFQTPHNELLQSSFLVPLLGDYLFRSYLPSRSQHVNVHLGVLMFCDLCRWLARMRLTKIQLDINLPYKQEFAM